MSEYQQEVNVPLNSNTSLGYKSFQAIDCTGIDNQTHNSHEKIHKKPIHDKNIFKTSSNIRKIAQDKNAEHQQKNINLQK